MVESVPRATGTDPADPRAAAQFHGDALVTPELVVVGSDAQPSGSLYAFEREGGALRWRHAFAGGVAVDVRRHGRLALATSLAGDVVAVDLASGEIAWWTDAGVDASGRPVDPALAGGIYYVGWPSGHLEPTTPPPERAGGAPSCPAVATPLGRFEAGMPDGGRWRPAVIRPRPRPGSRLRRAWRAG